MAYVKNRHPVPFAIAATQVAGYWESLSGACNDQ
jgi:hypothetical protein